MKSASAALNQLHSLKTANLSKTFTQGAHTTTVLKNVSFLFEQGKSYALTGVSGTGKSTLLQLLAGLESPDSGEIFFNGENIFKFSSQTRSFFLQKIGLVFQAPYLIGELSVIENVMIKVSSGESSINKLMRGLLNY